MPHVAPSAGGRAVGYAVLYTLPYSYPRDIPHEVVQHVAVHCLGFIHFRTGFLFPNAPVLLRSLERYSTCRTILCSTLGQNSARHYSTTLSYADERGVSRA